MKKIAIFQDDLGMGGIQKSIVNLLNNLDYKKYQVDLYLFKKDNFYEIKKNKNLRIIYKKSFHRIFRYLPYSFSKAFHKNDLQESYDVSIDFNSYQNETAFYASLVNSKKKYIFCHNDILLKKKHEFKYNVLFELTRSKYADFDSFVGVSSGALESLNKALKIKDKRGYVIPNMIDTKEIYQKQEEIVDFKVNNKDFNLVSMGRLTYQKGFDLLIEMISKVKRKNFKLYIIGSGEKEKKLRKQIKALNLEDKVILLGAYKNPFPILKQMDAFVLTSRYEGQGMVVLEAKALGLQIILAKHLEKYLDGVKGTKNVVKEIQCMKRKTKSFNKLIDYNKDVLKRYDNLFGGK